uniref:F-box domain-containing protein n=1 Tax=Ditylenchus dipsaci TaxID=166011 RepID=A0A915DQD7_9BILA
MHTKTKLQNYWHSLKFLEKNCQLPNECLVEIAQFLPKTKRAKRAAICHKLNQVLKYCAKIPRLRSRMIALEQLHAVLPPEEDIATPAIPMPMALHVALWSMPRNILQPQPVVDQHQQHLPATFQQVVICQEVVTALRLYAIRTMQISPPTMIQQKCKWLDLSGLGLFFKMDSLLVPICSYNENFCRCGLTESDIADGIASQIKTLKFMYCLEPKIVDL